MCTIERKRDTLSADPCKQQVQPIRCLLPSFHKSLDVTDLRQQQVVNDVCIRFGCRVCAAKEGGLHSYTAHHLLFIHPPKVVCPAGIGRDVCVLDLLISKCNQ